MDVHKPSSPPSSVEIHYAVAEALAADVKAGSFTSGHEPWLVCACIDGNQFMMKLPQQPAEVLFPVWQDITRQHDAHFSVFMVRTSPDTVSMISRDHWESTCFHWEVTQSTGELVMIEGARRASNGKIVTTSGETAAEA